MLENRPFLVGASVAAPKADETDATETVTDFQYVTKTLEANDIYKTGGRNVEASDYGSRSGRDRTFGVGFEGEHAQRKVDFVMGLIPTLKLSPYSPFAFLSSNPRWLPISLIKLDHGGNDACEFHDAHLEPYQQIGLPYPPDFLDMPDEFQQVMATLGTRSAEIAYFPENFAQQETMGGIA
jgi:hypothetical protein